MTLPQSKISLTLDQIQNYSICPRQLGYKLINGDNGNSSLSPIRKIVKEIIKQAYINRAQHSYTPQWETIKARVNKACFEDIDINNKAQFKIIYEQSITILNILSGWYHKIFLSTKHEGITNVPLSVVINRTTISYQADLVLYDSDYGIIPVLFNDNDILPTMLYNNIKYKSILWLLYKELDVISKLSQYIFIGPNSLQVHNIYNKEDSIKRTGRYLEYIVTGIEKQIFYPCISSECNTCLYKDICTI